jgi:tetratricopeptide (TPR) repeat protein
VPDQRNSIHVYRQAGAFYLYKETLVDGSAAPDAVIRDLRRLYARAMNMLDRAVLIARAEANAIPGASQEPEADAQRLRAVALLALQNPAAALVAAERARNLSPLQPLAYRAAASALLALKRDDEAVIALLTGSIVTADRSLGDAAVDLYRGGLDVDGCAVSGSGAAAVLNPRCPIVQRHSCAATADAVRIDMRIGRRDQAEQLRASAVGQLGCSADLLDRAMRP